jgi:hypothetical protein
MFLGKFIPPILTTTSRDAITSPKQWEVIANSTTGTYQFWDGIEWQEFFTAGGAPIPPSEIGGGASSMILSFASGGSKHVSSTSPTYESLAHCIYAGSDAVGPVTTINLNAWKSAGAATGDVRLVDLSTGLTIVESLGITSTLENNVLDMGTISNLPTTPTVFEVQGRKSGGGITLYIASIEFGY